MIPTKYFIDPDTNLALNTPSQWSRSPYLGAVTDKNHKKYVAHFSIPNEVWINIIDGRAKWKNILPESFFNEDSQYRSHIRVYNIEDPRQAAWIMQNVLYSDDYDTSELIEDYLEMTYMGGSGSIWNDFLKNVPEFEGVPLNEDDCTEYYKRFDKVTRDKMRIMRENEVRYDYRIKQMVLVEARKLKLNVANVADAFDNYGSEPFVTRYGSVILNDLNKVMKNF